MNILLACIAAAAITCVAATGCGELLPTGGSCTDQSCSRNLSNYCVKGFSKGEACNVSHECYIDLTCQDNVCEKSPKASQNMGIGLAAAFVATICFGSSFVPIKRFKKYAGDGVFSQFCMCFGRWFVGLIILLTRHNTTFYPHAALGGMFWAMGNALSVPIIQCIGMGLGIAIWGTTNMILGWASGAFGLWGIKKEVPETEWLSYMGVVFSFVSIVLFVFVKPHYQTQAEKQKEEFEKAEKEALLESGASLHTQDPSAAPGTIPNEYGNDPSSPASPTHPSRETIADVIGKKKARIIGVALALTAGVLFGICMDPSQRLMTRYEELSDEHDRKYTPDGLDYVFSFNTGAIGMSFITLLTYLIIHAFGYRPTERYFNPVEHSKIILPSFANGFIGSTASAAWFVANQNLGFIVSFPIIAAGPGVVSAAWGVLVFHEIKGRKNLLILGGAFVAVVASSVCSALGKGK